MGQNGQPLLAQVDVPAEQLAPGPCGYRIRVIDYDSSSGTLYQPLAEPNWGSYIDPFENQSIEQLLDNPQFHQQNVYAIAMRVLGRFEFALGRRVSWQFATHQLKIVPHAFREANAFYSRDHEALLFGYFSLSEERRKKLNYPCDRVYTCLSHDIVAHEATHAILDGVRKRFLYPSLPDQPAFHEGFSDVVAILSVVSVKELVEDILRKNKQDEILVYENETHGTKANKVARDPSRSSLDELKDQIELISPLVSLANQMGEALGGARAQALRASLEIKPDRTALTKREFQSPHRRGELLVAAVLRTVIRIARRRALKIGVKEPSKKEACKRVSAVQMADCFARAARDMLNICIRGLDYLVPVHVSFNDYLAAMLTADYELVGNDLSFGYRDHIIKSFEEYGIGSASPSKDGLFPKESQTDWLQDDRADYHAMMFNPDEMFRYLWENRDPLQISDEYYIRVGAVNPTVRVGPNGMMVSETVVEYVQSATLRGDELHQNGLRRPASMPMDARMELYGGGTLIFDVRGDLKYHIRFHLNDPRRQNAIIEHLSDRGHFVRSADHRPSRLAFDQLHDQRAGRGSVNGFGGESWQ